MNQKPSMDPARYFDHAATTPLRPEVFAEMLPYLKEGFGNPHSLHAWGRQAADAVRLARERVAQAIGAEDPMQVFFTSGATEANNWVLSLGRPVAVSPFEHASAWETAQAKGLPFLGNQGYRLDSPPARLGAAVMLVNNETGAVLEAPQADWLFRDITQAVGKIPVSLEGVDYATFSGHKLGGPKGVGVLFAREPESLCPLLHGGGQELGLRAGTLNVPGIVGMGLATLLAVEHPLGPHTSACRTSFFEAIPEAREWCLEPGPNGPTSILALSLPNVQGEAAVLDLDARGFAISSGAACSSRSTEPSHVLTALGMNEEQIRGAIRISFGHCNTPQSAKELGIALREVVHTLNRIRNV